MISLEALPALENSVHTVINYYLIKKYYFSTHIELIYIELIYRRVWQDLQWILYCDTVQQNKLVMYLYVFEYIQEYE